jgi:hypothetical protein
MSFLPDGELQVLGSSVCVGVVPESRKRPKIQVRQCMRVWPRWSGGTRKLTHTGATVTVVVVVVIDHTDVAIDDGRCIVDTVGGSVDHCSQTGRASVCYRRRVRCNGCST